jgi:hypothetical protein
VHAYGPYYSSAVTVIFPDRFSRGRSMGIYCDAGASPRFKWDGYTVPHFHKAWKPVDIALTKDGS